MHTYLYLFIGGLMAHILYKERPPEIPSDFCFLLSFAMGLAWPLTLLAIVVIQIMEIASFIFRRK